MSTIDKISRFLRRVPGYLKEQSGRHFTIMVIPHTEKKIFSFQISNYIILYMTLIVLLSAFTVYISQSRRQELTSDLETVKAQDRNYWDKYQKYKGSINDNIQAFDDYSGEVNKMMKVLGLPDKNFLWEGKGKDSSQRREMAKKFKKKYELEHHNVPRNILELNSLTTELDRTRHHLEVIEKVLQNRKGLLDHIPSRWPLYGNVGYKTSPFGKRYSPFLGRKMFHTGVDIAAPPRTPVLAAAAGHVIFAGIKRGYGYTVMLHHKFGYITLYGHNTRLLVGNGQRVKKGQKIALLGKSGRATGFHVHFEIRIAGEPVDPWPYITTEL